MIAESSRSFNPNRIKPELRRRAISTDVNMGWLISLSRVEKELVWPDVIKLGHILLSIERPSSPAAMKRSGIAVRWSVLLAKS
jgi:hypothetical protein